MKKEILQLVPVEEKDSEENEVTLHDTVVDAAEILLIMLVNQASKMMRIKKREEVGRALPLRTIQRVKLYKREEKCLKQVEGIEDEEIEAPDRFRAKVGGLLRDNHDVVARELGQTHTVKMKIDMCDHPLQLNPY